MSMNFSLILSNNSSAGFFSNSDSESGLLSNNNFESSNSLLSPSNNDSGMDAFGGKDLFGTCDISNFDGSFFANADTSEAAGSVAYGADTVGSVACGSSEAAGSIACGSGDSAGSCGGGSFSSVC